jgi:uncharacterized damage-inducible protein DinB
MADERVATPYCADERTMLTAWLEWQRATLAAKCEGLTADQLRSRTVEPSSMSLHGLVRHMAEVERAWFGRCIAREDLPTMYCTKADPDGDFDHVDEADPYTDIAIWHDECARARTVLAKIESLDQTGTRRQKPVSVRWILVHMIEEYARHNGHADLLRERIDGVTGY